VFSVALSVVPLVLTRPGVTWQPVHGARTFLETSTALFCSGLARDRPAGDVIGEIYRVAIQNSMTKAKIGIDLRAG
jgi:hypothetical protein